MSNLSFAIDSDGIGLVTLDMPGRPFNVFSDAMIDELEQFVARCEGETRLRGLVVSSGKDAFMAGADLSMVEGFTTMRYSHDAAEIRRTFSRLSYLLRRFERLAVPTVAAVNGLALGGGLELAMACHHRVAVRSAPPCLGLPEVLLGLLPGAGGTQRLPRLTSPAFAARLLLGGQPVTPAQAHAAGLIDQLADPAELIDSATAIARGAEAGARWDRSGWRAPDDAGDVLSGEDALAGLRQLAWCGARVAHLYPAVDAIARCLIDGYALPVDAGIDVEIDNFLPLMLDPVAGNMVRTGFLSRTAAPKRAATALGSPSQPMRRIAMADDAALPARLAKRFDAADAPGDADLVLVDGARSRPSAAGPFAIRLCRAGDKVPADCDVEVRYVTDLDRAEAVEIAAPRGEPAARAVALVGRLRLVPVAVSPDGFGPAARLLDVVRAFCAEHAQSPAARGALAAALDLGRLFESAGLESAEADGHGAGDRVLGLELLHAVALEAAACLADGVVAGAQDLDVLAVVGCGFPAWSGGPLTLLDCLARGELDGAVALARPTGEAFYPQP